MVNDYDELMRVLRGRRSIRSFRADPVSADLIEKLIEAARWAPSASNRQAYRFLAVTSRSDLERMAEAVLEETRRVLSEVRPDAEAYLDSFVRFRSAPLVLAPIFRDGFDLLEASTRGRAGDPERALLDAHASVCAATMNLLLAAHALGLGACWMTGPLIAKPALSTVIGVPSGWRLAALVPVGHPAEQPEIPPRRSVARLWKEV
jgi:coenzyme F420-0:L-glutamate ligase/coenzyme F420-1:gamma-L-glutamate ligase